MKCLNVNQRPAKLIIAGELKISGAKPVTGCNSLLSSVHSPFTLRSLSLYYPLPGIGVLTHIIFP
jgi:hypothetical protein